MNKLNISEAARIAGISRTNLYKTYIFDDKIAEFGSKLPGFENVSSIKGIGTNTAVTLLSSIGDINDFEDEKKLAAYFGLVPRVSNSNETVNHGRITK